MNSNIIRRGTLLLGRCTLATREGGVEVAVDHKELDVNLKMYFTERTEIRCYDKDSISKPGDIVLIRKLPDPMTRKVSHEIMRVVYNFGQVVDPITGKRAMATQFRDDVTRRNLLLGESGFNAYLSKKQSSKVKE